MGILEFPILRTCMSYWTVGVDQNTAGNLQKPSFNLNPGLVFYLQSHNATSYVFIFTKLFVIYTKVYAHLTIICRCLLLCEWFPTFLRGREGFSLLLLTYYFLVSDIYLILYNDVIFSIGSNSFYIIICDCY